MKKGLVGNAMMLALSSVIAKLLGAAYRIPLTNILGAEGMGMYQLVFPIYALFLTLSTSGFPTALSRLVAERRMLGESGKNYLFATFFTLAIFSAISTIVVVAFASNISVWQGNGQTVYAYYMIAPAIIFVAGIACFRGWFQGNLNMVPTSISNIIEQVVKLCVGLGLSIAFLKKGLIYAVYGAIAGVTISEISAFIFMLITYAVTEKKRKASCVGFDCQTIEISARPQKKEFFNLYRIGGPISMIAVLLPLTQFLDSFIILNLLKTRGITTAIATSEFGLLTGPVGSLINLPIVILLSLAITIVPTISAGRVQRDLEGILKKSALSIKLTYLIGMPSVLLFIVFSRQIITVLYPAINLELQKLTIILLCISSISIIFMSGMQIYTALMQALDQSKKPVRNLIFAIFIKIVFQIVLTMFVGIIGSAIASVVLSFLAFGLDAIAFHKYVGRNIKLVKNVSTIFLCSVIMALVGMIFAYLVKNIYISLFVGLIVCVGVYFVLILASDSLSDEEALSLPAGKYLIKIKNKMRFWE